MTIENIYQAKTHLSRLVDQALDGQDVVIARQGRPLVRLIPYEERPEGIRTGLLKGRIEISEDFDDPSLNAEIWAGYVSEDGS